MSTSTITPAVIVARPYPGGFMPSVAGSWHQVSPVVSSAADAINASNAFAARQSVPTALTVPAAKPAPTATRAMNSNRLAYDAKQVKGAQPPRGTPR